MNFFDYGFGDFTNQSNQNNNPNPNPGADPSSNNIFNAFNFKDINNQPPQSNNNNNNNNQYMQQQPQHLYQQQNNNPYNNISYSIQPPQNNFIANNNINLLQTPLKENPGAVGAAESGNQNQTPKIVAKPLLFSDDEDDVDDQQKLPVYKEQKFKVIDNNNKIENIPVYQKMNMINSNTNYNNNNHAIANKNTGINYSNNPYQINNIPQQNNYNQNTTHIQQTGNITNSVVQNNKSTYPGFNYQNLNSEVNSTSDDIAQQYSGIGNVSQNQNQTVGIYNGNGNNNSSIAPSTKPQISNQQSNQNQQQVQQQVINNNNNQNNTVQNVDNSKFNNKNEANEYDVDDDINEITIHQSQIQMKQIKPTFNLTNVNNNNNINDQKPSTPTKNNQEEKQQSGTNEFAVSSGMGLQQFMQGEVSKSANDWIIDLNTVIFEQIIGTGNSSEVYKGSWRGTDVAIKQMKIQQMNSHHIQQFQREITALIQVRPHQNLVALVGVAQKESQLYIITEYCSGGTLFDLLHRRKQHSISWEQRLQICKDIAQGMYYLHTAEPPIIHRDLQSLNLLLDDTFQGQNEKILIKIADFGLARVQNEMMTGVLGTFHWMAPEIFQNKPYTTKADVYSFGIVIWEICSRETPYRALSNPHAIMKFVTIDKGRPNLAVIPNDCPQKLKDLMMVCWDEDPNQRPDFQQILSILKTIEFQ